MNYFQLYILHINRQEMHIYNGQRITKSPLRMKTNFAWDVSHDGLIPGQLKWLQLQQNSSNQKYGNQIHQKFHQWMIVQEACKISYIKIRVLQGLLALPDCQVFLIALSPHVAWWVVVEDHLVCIAALFECTLLLAH